MKLSQKGSFFGFRKKICITFQVKRERIIIKTLQVLSSKPDVNNTTLEKTDDRKNHPVMTVNEIIEKINTEFGLVAAALLINLLWLLAKVDCYF